MTPRYWTGLWLAVCGLLLVVAFGKRPEPPATVSPMTARDCPRGLEFPCTPIPLDCKPADNGGQVCTGRLIVGQEKI